MKMLNFQVTTIPSMNMLGWISPPQYNVKSNHFEEWAFIRVSKWPRNWLNGEPRMSSEPRARSSEQRVSQPAIAQSRAVKCDLRWHIVVPNCMRTMCHNTGDKDEIGFQKDIVFGSSTRQFPLGVCFAGEGHNITVVTRITQNWWYSFMVPTYMVMDYSCSIYTGSTWHLER